MNADDAPWEPPELALRVGELVRFTPRTECKVCWGRRAPWDGTPEEWDGLTGVVVAVVEVGSHPYRARPLVPSRFSGAVWDCARGELRRLAASDPRAGDGDTQEPRDALS